MSGELVELDRKDPLTEQEAIAVAARMPWDDGVLVVGLIEGGTDLQFVLGGEITNMELVWLAHLILDRFGPGGRGVLEE